MAREIKFRAWDEVYAKFVYSSNNTMSRFWQKVESGTAVLKPPARPAKIR